MENAFTREDGSWRPDPRFIKEDTGRKTRESALQTIRKRGGAQCHCIACRAAEEEAEDWACRFSEEWNFSLDMEQNLSQGV